MPAPRPMKSATGQLKYLAVNPEINPPAAAPSQTTEIIAIAHARWVPVGRGVNPA